MDMSSGPRRNADKGLEGVASRLAPELARERRQDERGVADPVEWNEDGSPFEAVGLSTRGLDRESRLPDASRTGERQQSNALLADELIDPLEFEDTADEARRRRRDHCGRRGERVAAVESLAQEQREIGREQLAELLGRAYELVRARWIVRERLEQRLELRLSLRGRFLQVQKAGHPRREPELVLEA
jgi:hypothetical protein